MNGAAGTRPLIQTVTEDTFDVRVLQANGPVAVEFMSYGCAHCRILEPFLEEAAARLESKEQVFRVNIATDETLAARYAVEGTPTLLMFLDADEVGRSEGVKPTIENVMSAMTAPFER